jgi:hypothetical protein
MYRVSLSEYHDLTVILLNAIMTSHIMLSVIMLSVLAPIVLFNIQANFNYK